MFRQLVMLLEDLQVVRQIGQDLHMIADSRIWKKSDLGALMANSGKDTLLLGDEGYGIAPCLMTPYKEPLNSPQERSYNNHLIRECLIIGRCFGQLKRRFPILQGRVKVHLNLVPSEMVACLFLVILHRGLCNKCRVNPSFINIYNKWPPERTSWWVNSDNTPAAIA